MQQNPDWVKNVEKAQPGIIDSIRQDLQEIIPVTDITGRGIPGQQYGSGRFALGAGVGAIVSKMTGLDLRTTMGALSLLSGLSGKVGFELSPRVIQRGFSPRAATPSRLGGMVGAFMAPAIGGETSGP